MSYRIKRKESVQHAVRRIADEQLAKAVAEIDDPHRSRDSAVHQVRKRCKKLRGLLRMVRPAIGKTYARENAILRDAARTISSVRDAQSMIATYDALMRHFADQVHRPSFGGIRRELSLRRNAIDEGAAEQRLLAVRETLLEMKGRAEDWTLREKGFDAIEGGIVKTRRRAVDRLADALDQPETERLHEFRKRCKYQWYQMRLIQPVWPAMIDPLRKSFSELGDLLGDDHDLAILCQTLDASPEAFGSAEDVQAAKGLIDQRRQQLQRQSLTLGQFVLAESNQAFVDRMRLYWNLWRS
ncbi:MAG: CHAD domain-containing protein [Pirellulaceae bacterium]